MRRQSRAPGTFRRRVSLSPYAVALTPSKGWPIRRTVFGLTPNRFPLSFERPSVRPGALMPHGFAFRARPEIRGRPICLPSAFAPMTVGDHDHGGVAIPDVCG
jgi:hypothetical protein